MGLDRFSEHERQTCLGGIRPEAAVENILRRRDERGSGAESGPRRRTAVVLQGGAMRGVISAGAMVPMEALGFTQGFDAVYGCSAGAINGAYFLARQAAFGASIYYRDVANRRFINLLRPRKMMDMDFVFDEVVGGRSRVDVEFIRQNPTPLRMVATEIATGNGVVFSSQDEGIDLLRALRASSAVPVLYHRPVALNGSAYLDGSVADPLPLQRAIDDGCTDILVVLTLPKPFRAKPPGVLERQVAHRWLHPLSPALAEVFCRRHLALNRALELAAGTVPPEEAPPVNIVAVFPDAAVSVGSLTKRVRVLKRAAVDAAVRMMRLFSDEPSRPVELIQFVPGDAALDLGH